MKRLKVWLVLTFCIGLCSVSVKSQVEDLQTRFDLLLPRLTNLEQIEKIIGRPDSQKIVFEWIGNIRENGGFRGHSRICRDEDFGRKVKRNIHELDYPNAGIKLQVFDNPWNLYSVEVLNPEISVLNSLKVGDSLEKVQKQLGKGSWETTEGSDFWTLAYDKKSLKFILPRDKSIKQFPMKLVRDATVSKIEVFDKESSFAGCSEDIY